ncbi:ornithine cyclodeaminase [Comamonadaceae bacterium M7527]|nr:ornithine cyclodeaminase [Comamonadaceae bacterium M7527]
MRADTLATAHLPTVFLSTQDIAAVVQARGLGPVIAGVAQCIEQDFLRWGDFDKSARVANHSKEGVIELMPVSDDTTYSVKYVNGHPNNHRVNLPTVMAFGWLSRVDTGAPTLVSELTLTTAIRTAAMSALVARHLARANSRTMAIIGNGAQSEFQCMGFAHMMGITHFRLFDVDAAASDKLATHLRAAGLGATICADTWQACQGADIVTTVTADKTNALIIQPGMLGAGTHLNAVGGDCPGKTEIHPDVLASGPVFVEFEPQTRIEGDTQRMADNFPVTELWQVLTGNALGRTDDAQITIFDSVGFALEDYSALRYMGQAALDLGLGHPLALIPALANPKNLYALLGQPVAAHAPAQVF